MRNKKLMTPGKWYSEFDANGNCIAVTYDASFRKLLGYESEEEFSDTNEAWAGIIHPDDAQRLDAYFSDCCSRHPEGMDYDIEYRMKTRWGYRWFHDYARVTRRDDGSPLHFDGVVFDIQEGLDKVDTINHEQLRREVLAYMVDHLDDPIELLKEFAERLRVLINCDQVIYRDLEETRIMVNSPEIEKTWSVPIEYCQQCEHFDAHHSMYKDGYTEMNNCQEGWRGIPVYKDCPIKSSLTRIVYCDGEVAGYLAIHYVQKYHEFTDIERATLEEFTRILSMSLSRYEAKKHAGEVSSIKKTLSMNFVLSNQFDPIMVVDPETGEYEWLMSVADNVADNTAMSLHGEDFYKDIGIDTATIIHPDTREHFRKVYSRENLMKIAETGEVQETENRWFIKTEGQYRWKYNKLVRMVDDDGKVFVVVGVIDTTEAKKEEEKNRAQKQLFEEQQALAENAVRFFALEDTFESLYDVELESGHYFSFVKGDFYQSNVIDKLVDPTDYFEDLRANIDAVIYPEDREGLFSVLTRESIRKELAQSDHYDYYYRLMTEDGPTWFKIRIVYRDDEKKNIIIGVFNAAEEIAVKEKEERLRQELIEQMAGDDGVLLVDCVNDTKMIIHDRVHRLESIDDNSSYSEGIEEYIQRFVVESDREMMRQKMNKEYMLERAKAEREYSVRYKETLSGEVRYFDMHVARFSETTVLQSFKDVDVQANYELAQNAISNDFFAIYLADLNSDSIRVVKRSYAYKSESNMSANTYSRAIHEYLTGLVEKEQKKWSGLDTIEGVKKFLSHQDKREILYESAYREHRLSRVTWYVLDRVDGEANTVCLAFADLDKEQASRERLHEQIAVQNAQLEKDMQMISGLASGYDALYYINIDESNYSIYTLDDTKYPGAREAFEEGCDFYDVIRTYGTSEFIYPDDRILFHDFGADTIRKKLTGLKKYSIRFRVDTGNGFRWDEMDIVKYEDIDEKANAIAVGFADRDADIRREQEYQQQLEDAREAADAANRSKSNFLFNMSHDIRTPMNAIRGFTAMAKKHADDREKVTGYLEKIDISGQQLLSLINQVLEMARIESGKIEFNEEPVNVREEFSSMVTVLSEQAEANGLKFSHSLGNIEHSNILADEARMSSITLNIAGNAMKYTPEGGSVAYELKEIPGRRPGYASYIFSVSDTGIGMSKEYLEKLYEPFSREKNTTVSKIQGTGLGLSIVKSTIDLMGGNIEVQSEPGKGTRFDITVDFKIDENANAPDEETDEVKAVSFEGRRVLLVEDNEMNREIARDILEEQRVIVEDAEDGDVAVAMVQAAVDRGEYNYYDFVLMDVQMPRMNGYDATKAIRAIDWPENVHLPIIAMTANAFEEDKQNALAAGMDEHLAKPIDIQKMFATIARFL